MASQVQCPQCGRLVIPLEKSVVIRNKPSSLKRRNTWIVIGVTGILMIIIGSSVYFHYGFSIVGLTGLAVAVFDILLMGFLIFHYRETGKRRYQQICPLCKHRWMKSGIEVSGPDALEAYFTNVEQMRAEFDRFLIAPILSRRLLIIHGVGGVGKSSLLRMFRLQSRTKHVPVALSLGDEAKSSVDILSDWAKDLIAQDIELSTFTQILNEYQNIQKKVEERAKFEGKLQGERGKAAIKMAVQATSSIAGSIPIVGLPLSIVLVLVTGAKVRLSSGLRA